MDAKQLAKLVRKNAEKAEKVSKNRNKKNYDQTLPKASEDDEVSLERNQFFKEMKRREF